MTFKKADMAKTLRNGLSMIETNPLNHNWTDFAIQSGLTLHQFQTKLLLSTFPPGFDGSDFQILSEKTRTTRITLDGCLLRGKITILLKIMNIFKNPFNKDKSIGKKV